MDEYNKHKKRNTLLCFLWLNFILNNFNLNLQGFRNLEGLLD